MRAANRFQATILLSALALAAGAATAAEPGPSASDCFVAAFKSADVDGVAACYAEDALMWFPGGPMVQGRAAIRDGFAGFLEGMTVKDVELDTMGHETMGDTRVAWGTYAIHRVNKETGAVTVDRGRFTDVSKKIDGRWLYVVDHPSAEPVPAGE